MSTAVALALGLAAAAAQETAPDASALFAALSRCDSAQVAELLDGHPEWVEAESEAGEPALAFAFRHCSWTREPPAVLRVLLERGARDRPPPDDPDGTVLARAAELDDLGVVRLLLEHDRSRLDRISYLTGGLAAAARGGGAGLIELLIAEGAEVDGAQDGSASPIAPPVAQAAARGRREVVELLAGHGAALELLALTALDRLDELRPGAPLEAPHPVWLRRTPLHVAVANGSLRSAEALLARNADPSAPDRYGDTPLHLAVGRGDQGAVALLVRHGSLVGARRGRPFHDPPGVLLPGVTPLEAARALGDEEILRVLESAERRATAEDERFFRWDHVARGETLRDALRMSLHYAGRFELVKVRGGPEPRAQLRLLESLPSSRHHPNDLVANQGEEFQVATSWDLDLLGLDPGDTVCAILRPSHGVLVALGPDEEPVVAALRRLIRSPDAYRNDERWRLRRRLWAAFRASPDGAASPRLYAEDDDGTRIVYLAAGENLRHPIFRFDLFAGTSENLIFPRVGAELANRISYEDGGFLFWRDGEIVQGSR